jgi:hypothetical protein
MSKRNTRAGTSRAETSTALPTVPVPKKKRKPVPQELPQEPTQVSQVSQVPQVSQVSQVSQVQVSQKTIEKLINQNAKIMSKLDQVISGQKSLNDRMIKLEKVPDVQNDEELIKVIKTLVIYILFKYYAILRLLRKLTQYSN